MNVETFREELLNLETMIAKLRTVIGNPQFSIEKQELAAKRIEEHEKNLPLYMKAAGYL